MSREEWAATEESLRRSGYRIALIDKAEEGLRICLLDADCTGPMETRIFRRGSKFRGFIVCTQCGGALALDHP